MAKFAGAERGYAYRSRYRAKPAYRISPEDTVYGVPGSEGRGLGGALRAALVAHCGEPGYRRMVAVIGNSANRDSIRLHESQGFRTCGIIPSVGFKFRRRVNSIPMERPLGPGNICLPN